MRLVGLSIQQIIRILSGFLRFIFRGISYQILTRAYFAWFRLKKDIAVSRGVWELGRRQIGGLIIIVLVGGTVLANIFPPERAAAAETKIAHTVMAGVIPTEFEDLQNEVLIEEGAAPLSTLAAGKNKYFDDDSAIGRQEALSGEGDGEDILSLFSETWDFVTKPRSATSGLAEGGAPLPRTETIYYVVQKGDVVSTIARRFNISINTILWANNLTAYSLIRPGDSLAILPTTGVLYTVKSGDTVSKVASRYQISAEKILSYNSLGEGLQVGQKIILPGAQKIAGQVAARTTTSYSGAAAVRDLITPSPVKTASGQMVWPAVGHRITQYYSWRHTGLDIGNKVGTPLYAADDGVVEVSRGGWNGGYGNTILINHGGGVKTRYGHASKLLVKAGEEVEKGQLIALMGSTGRSTGSHLHFEVLVSGRRQNPLNYVR